MSIFDNIFGDLLANFSEWIKIEDDQCPCTIQDFFMFKNTIFGVNCNENL